MKVKCKVCGEWFEKENLYCDHCAAKYGAERSRYDIDLFEDQRSLSKEDQAKMAKRQEKKSTKKTTILKESIPDFDTMRDLRPSSQKRSEGQGKKKSFGGTIKGIVFFFVILNVITGVISDMDFDDLINEFINGDDGAVVYEETAVPILEEEKKSFPMNPVPDFSGDASPVYKQALGIYQGTLSTATYLNFDSKDMRFEIKDHDFSGNYQLPIFITVTEAADSAEYFFDIWDQNTLKTLGTYIIQADQLKQNAQGEFEGNSNQYFYDEEGTNELKASYDELGLKGRLALPYTIDNEVNYFNFQVDKVNDDASALISRTYLENEYNETFKSDDESMTIDFYTYNTPQGYPHSSMYYNGVFVLTDGDEGYPPMPFNIGESSDIYANMSYMNTTALTIKDKDFSDSYYYDDVDAQFYRYFPVETEDSVYDFELTGTIYREGDDTVIEGQYRIYNRQDDGQEITKDFSVRYLAQ